MQPHALITCLKLAAYHLDSGPNVCTICFGLMCSEKEALERAHAKALDSMRAQEDDNREAWRSALAERMKRDMADKEKQLRANLTQERNEELEVGGQSAAL